MVAIPKNSWCIPVTESFLTGMSHLEMQLRRSDEHFFAVMVDRNEVKNAGIWELAKLPDNLHKLINQGQKISRYYSGSHFSWIPENFPAEELFLNEVVGEVPRDFVLDSKSFSNYGTALVAMPPSHHWAWSLKGLSFFEKKSPLIFVQADELRVHLSVFLDGEMKLFTTYHAEELSDLVYYMLFCLEQLKAHAESTHVTVSGCRFDLEQFQEQVGRFVASVDLLWDKSFPSWSAELNAAGFEGRGFELDRFLYAYH
jgi:hypothetical protein